MGESNFPEKWSEIKKKLKERKYCVFWANVPGNMEALFVFQQDLLKDEQKIDKVKNPTFINEDLDLQYLQELLKEDEELVRKVKAKYNGGPIYLVRGIEETEDYLKERRRSRPHREDRINFRETDPPYHM